MASKPPRRRARGHPDPPPIPSGGLEAGAIRLVVGVLLDEPSVAALVSDRVWYQTNPRGLEYPAIFCSVLGDAELISAFGGYSALRSVRVRVQCSGQSYTEAAGVLAAVVDLLRPGWGPGNRGLVLPPMRISIDDREDAVADTSKSAAGVDAEHALSVDLRVYRD